MILLYALLGLFAIFVSPQIFLYKKYHHLSYSFVLIYGLIISYTASWVIFLCMFYFHIPNIILQIFVYMIVLYSLKLLFLVKEYNPLQTNYSFIWIVVLCLMLPLLNHIGMGYTVWDALASWNKWALELFENTYYPIDAAYPILMPSLWSLIYKIQGTSEVWWTAQLTLFILPLFVLAILFTLYRETKLKTYLFMAVLIYPYLLSMHTINGNMDMPVMILGTLSLIALYTAEYYKGKVEFEYYIYTALLLAGIASITKQAGIAFILFNIVYIVLNFKLITHKKRLYLVIIFTLLYLLSYLSLYYIHNISTPIGNLQHLGTLSEQKFLQYDLTHYLEWLYGKFFDLPETLSMFSALLSLLKIKFVTPLLIILGLLLFLFKDLRQYKSVSFLSAIFFLFSTLLWAKYFSYDERNALWVKAFFILFLSINLNAIIDKYVDKIYYFRVIWAILFLSIITFVVYLGDTMTYKVQKDAQLQAGVRYSCLPSIKYAVKLLEGADECVRLYTNELPMPQNYLLKDYKDKIILMGRDYKYQNFEYLHHDCDSGSYIIFRRNSMGHPQEWSKVIKLGKEGIIHPIKNNSVLAYFVPANITLDKSFFRKNKEVHFKLLPFKTNVKYYIDVAKEYNDKYFFSGWAFIEDIKMKHTKKYMILRNNKKEYIIELEVKYRLDIPKVLKNTDLNTTGFIASIMKKDFSSGSYEIHLLLIDNNKHYQVSLDKNITL